MKTVILFASPNENGNTSYLLEKYLEGQKGEVNIFDAFKENVKPCIDCGYCSTHNSCSIKDNMTDIYHKIDDCDVFVIASPIYFSAFPAPLKAMLDRFQLYWSKKYTQNNNSSLKNKRGILILTAGSNNEKILINVEATASAILPAIGAKLNEKIYVLNTDKVKVKDNEIALKLAYEIGKKQK